MKFPLLRLVRGIVLLLVVAAIYGYIRDLSAPTVTANPDSGVLAPSHPVELLLADAGVGLRALTVKARQGGKESLLLEKTYADEAAASEKISLTTADLSDGPLELVVETRDGALFPFGNGNRTRRILTYTVDKTPPVITLQSGVTPLWQGGAAVIAYTVSEETARSGVEADDLFFPGYRQASGVYLCVVGLPANRPLSGFKPRLLAVDRGGNEQQVSPGLQLLARNFPLARIPVSDAFLSAKDEEFRQSAKAGATPLELFLHMNRDVREENRRKLVALARESHPTPLWSEAMLRMPRAKTTGDYAEARDYFYANRLVDHQTHLGTDLASVAQAPILAANPGKVVFAGYLGIYGGCVVIDHGLGVQTLYGHLSATEVQAGESVTRGQQVGRSGKTGMAAGDHLHFEVLVSGVPVRPEEWMERGWMETYILGPLRQGQRNGG